MDKLSISGNSVFEKQKDIVHRSIAGENLLVPIRGRLADMQRIFALNTVADFIWGQIDGNASVNDVIDAVAARFDTDAAQAKTDTSAMVGDLAAAGLIVMVR